MGLVKQFFSFSPRRRLLLVLILGLFFGLLGTIAAMAICRLVAESLWFHNLGFLSVLWQRWQAQFLLVMVTFFVSWGFLWLNGALALQLRLGDAPDIKGIPKPLADAPTPLPPAPLPWWMNQGRDKGSKGGKEDRPWGITLPWLLLITVALGWLLCIVCFHSGAIALELRKTQPISLINNPFLEQLDLATILTISRDWLTHPLSLVLSAGMIILLLVWPGASYGIMSMALSLSLAWLGRNNWTTVLKGLAGVNVNRSDPLFGQDIGFYLFSLPLWELYRFWIVALGLGAIAGVALIYLLGADSLSQGRSPGFNRPQRRHLQALGAVVFAATGLSFWLERYKLVYSPQGVTFGASYTDITVRLPLDNLFSFLAIAVAVLLLWAALRKGGQQRQRLGPVSPWVLWFTLGYVAVAIVGAPTLPALIQNAIVQPNELQREFAYIRRTIDHTREGFDLEKINAQPFQPQNNLTPAILQENEATTRNIRLWDTRPLLETNRQLQQLRSYYSFPKAFIDRYNLKTEPGNPTAESRQVLVAARELDYGAVKPIARSWVNEHLVYTHGYGFTMSPVNTAAESGLPEYFVKDISEGDRGGDLLTSNPQIRDSIPVGHPRIYYGQITSSYVLAPSQVQELDYPSGNDNVYNHYDGSGGVPLNSWWGRLVFGAYFQDWQLLLTPNIKPESRVLFRRNIQQRVQAIAPFLRFDSEPYLVIADPRSPETTTAKDAQEAEPNYLYWIIDAYTISRHYPYSDPGDQPFNYIRNSVKVIVDAYDGSVKFYVVEPTDPLIQTWQRVFPDLFEPIGAMPQRLYEHIRYPVDMMRVQSQQLRKYHMTDPVVFYSQEDQWQIPQEIYGNDPQTVAPYYLITKLPTAPQEEFILLLPFTPINRPNLIAWLAARSDGENYGKLLLYQFPKQELVFGPEQMEARINQDPVISQQISLWNRQGSRSLQGNLLIIPVEQSLLYVEPIYLEAQYNSLPILARVVVMDNQRIAMAETLEAALDELFVAPAIAEPIQAGEIAPDLTPQ
ncbi:UPF0182 family protein [Candidatus Synechococcus calcipolaris G9]|uniref:UPF0182 protein L3556_03085 n=1 Tax=Candidatus Synechococcus calcipolaris G9 TaxID=1497997 RepID=A0ABT6EVW3_9SYNE|nr:UPF0182 family protein [Candidatus Synechococcus calcipolaris]MDG2989922.1 UPF0182 family protein [Candidatus Synechococcus calcipolaris G9]